MTSGAAPRTPGTAASSGRRAALVLAMLLGALGAVTVVGSQARGGLVLSSQEGRVLRARLASGAIVELDGEMEVRFRGASARVIFRRATEGLSASARAEDVEVRIAREVWTADEAIGLEPRAHVMLRSAGARDAIVEARGLGVSLAEVRVPLDAIALPARSTRTSPSAAPEAWARAGTGPRRLLAASATPRRAPHGRALELTRTTSVEVGVVEEVEGWTRIALEDSGIRVLAWVEAGALTEPTPRSPASGGGGLGEGRIGLSRCDQEGARTMHTRSSERVWRDAGARTPLVTLQPRVSVVVRDGAGPRLAVLELPGAQRVGRCDTPIGWIARTALDARRDDPIDED